MKWLFKKFEKAYDKKVDSIGLSVFRFLYAVVLFCEVYQLLYFKSLVFDVVPFIESYDIDFAPALKLWLVFIFFISIGFFTKVSTIANYLFSLVFIATIDSFEYHMFYAYMGINFILMFMPLSKSYSVDRIINRIKYSNAHYTHCPVTQVSVIYYYIPVFIGIGLVYFDSVLYKFTSPVWMSGLGMWKPAVLPHFNHFGNIFILNNEFLAKSFGYITLIFETIFIFLFWYKSFRVSFLIIGLALHIGILIIFPIPWFALGVSAIYILLMPFIFWKKIEKLFRSKKQSITFIYDGNCPLCNRVRIFLSSLDIFNKIDFITAQTSKQRFKELSETTDEQLVTHIYSVDSSGKIRRGIDTYISVFIRMKYLAPLGCFLMIPGIYQLGKKVYSYIADNRARTPCNDDNCAIVMPVIFDENKKILKNLTIRNVRILLITLLFIAVIFMQICVSYHSPLPQKIISNKFQNTPVGRFINQQTGDVWYKSKIYFGITNHPVFMDSHLRDYNHIVAVVYKDIEGNERWLPIIDKNGQPDYYIYGANWVKWTFRVNGPNINFSNLFNGLKRFTAFWAGKNNISLENATFKVLVKKINVPEQWEKDFLLKQINNPWVEAGTISWKNKIFSLDITDIEAL